MNVEVKQLKDTLTGEVFVPLTHWDAVANKPEDIAKESTVISLSQDIISTVNALAQALSQQMLDNTGDLAKELTNQEILSEIGNIDEALDELNGENIPLDFVSDYAKQGDNPDATNSAIMSLIGYTIEEIDRV